MSAYIPVVVAVLVIGIISIVMDRRWQARKAAKDAPEQSDAQESEDTTEKSSGLGGLRARMLGGKNKDLPKKFQAWAEKNMTTAKEKGMKSWISDLSPDEAKVFTEQVAAYCADMNMDLAWLVDEKLDKDPALEKATKNIVTSYCMACLASYAISD